MILYKLVYCVFALLAIYLIADLVSTRYGDFYDVGKLLNKNWKIVFAGSVWPIFWLVYFIWNFLKWVRKDSYWRER